MIELPQNRTECPHIPQCYVIGDVPAGLQACSSFLLKKTYNKHYQLQNCVAEQGMKTEHMNMTGNVRWYKDMCRTPLTFLQKDVGAKRDAKHNSAIVLKTITVVDLVALPELFECFNSLF